MVDPTGPLTIAFVLACMAFAEFAMTSYYIPLWFVDSDGNKTARGVFLESVFTVVIGLATVSYLRAWLTDPGYTPRLTLDPNWPLE